MVSSDMLPAPDANDGDLQAEVQAEAEDEDGNLPQELLQEVRNV